MLQIIKDLNSEWFLGCSEDQPLYKCLENAELKKHKFIVAYDYFVEGMNRPTKVYGSYKNSKIFYRSTNTIEDVQRCFYVIIPENTKCCLFSDLEWDISWKSIDEIKYKFIQIVSKTLKQKSEIEVQVDDFLICNASVENKGSLHVHLPNVCFNDISEQQKFFNAVYEELDDDWFFIDESDKSYILKTFIDFGVYNKNRQIRLPYSSKMNKNGVGVRPLIPEDEENFDFQQWTIVDLVDCNAEDAVDVSTYPSEISCNKRNVWSKELVQEVVDNLGLDVSVDTFRGKNLIPLRNKKSIRVCPINGEENKSDNAYLVIKDNKLHYYCHDENCKGQSKIIHQFEEERKVIIQKMLDECVFGSHSDCAKMFNYLYGDNIYVLDKKTIAFYHWNKDKLLWDLEPSETMIRLINQEIQTILLPEITRCFGKINDEEKYKERYKSLLKFKNNIGNTTFIQKVIKFYSSFDIDKEFESQKMNKTPYQLPIKNGNLIDLRTLEVRKRTKKDFWSIQCNVEYDPTLDLSKVHKFMDSITCNSAELKDYHRRFWGYLMTGEISDRSLHIFWGNGCNGKSSIVNIFKNIMGDTFSTSLSEDVMIGDKKSRGASPEMMDLLYSRCGVLPESDKKEKINSKRIKTITGDDDIKARHLYGHLMQFRTQCKTIFPTNYKPIIDVEDQAILDRLKLIPFSARFESTEENTKYIKNLQSNFLNEFFTWFCSGAKDWYGGQSLQPCQEMAEEMNKYIAEMDTVAEFVDDMFDIVSQSEYDQAPYKQVSNYRTERKNMYPAFLCWLSNNNIRDNNMSKKDLFRSLSKKYTCISKGHKFYYLLRLKNQDNDSDQPVVNEGSAALFL